MPFLSIIIATDLWKCFAGAAVGLLCIRFGFADSLSRDVALIFFGFWMLLWLRLIYRFSRLAVFPIIVIPTSSVIMLVGWLKIYERSNESWLLPVALGAGVIWLSFAGMFLLVALSARRKLKNDEKAKR